MEHRPTATGTKDAEISGTLRDGTGQAHGENNEGEKKSFHRLQPENEGLRYLFSRAAAAVSQSVH
jgi:hypothetical protein